MEIGCKHETNLNSLKKLAKDEHLTVNVVNTEKRQTRSHHKHSNKGTDKQDIKKRFRRKRTTRQDRQVWEVWLQQNPQEISSNGTTVQFLQKDESLFQAL